MARKTSPLLLNSFFLVFLFIIAPSLSSLKAVVPHNVQDTDLQESTDVDDNGQGKGSVGPSRSGHAGSEAGGNSPPSGSVNMPPPSPAMKMKFSKASVTVSSNGTSTRNSDDSKANKNQQISVNGSAPKNSAFPFANVPTAPPNGKEERNYTSIGGGQ